MIKDFNVGVKGVIKVADKCLVLKCIRDGTLYWNVPGGRIDNDETIEETLRRELSEELPTLGNYIVGDILNAFRLEKDLKNGSGLLLLFYKIEADDFEVNLNDEHFDFKWVSKDNISDLLSDPNIHMADGYYQAVKKALE